MVKLIYYIFYSYRLKQAMAINNLQNIYPEMEDIISKRISYAVDIHCKAMMLVYDTQC